MKYLFPSQVSSQRLALPCFRVPLLVLPFIALPCLARADALTAPAASAPAATAPAATALPLRDVVLFSSGVGYFGRQGRIAGASQIDLPFRTTQISDILKSLVLSDPQNGIGPVTYSLADYIAARPVASLAVPATASLGEILKGFQGAQVRLVKNSGALEGRILSVTTRQVKVDTGLETVEVLTLLTPEGLTTTSLDDVLAVKLSDPALDASLRDSMLRQGAAYSAKVDDGIRTISLHFTGSAPRTVAAGYLEETPAWKTSYRLVVGPTGNATIQGWAIVENTTDSDWRNVNLNLVSGQPVSFIQDLMAPVYVSRPVMPTSVIGSAQPQTYGGGYDLPAHNGGVTAPTARDAAGGGGRDEKASDGISRARKDMVAASYPRKSAPDSAASPSFAALPSVTEALQRSVAPTVPAAEAAGAKRGELFAYSISDPVTLPAGQAAMVPIVGAPVQGKPVTIAISDGEVGELTPANGFRLKNTTGEHLQGGPITVYAGGIYAGDALTNDLAPNETRLISYAADLDASIRLDDVKEDEEITKLSALSGTLSITTRYNRTRTFLIKNKSAAAKSVLIQLPHDDEYKLLTPAQLLEKSADGDRFALQVPAGKTVSYHIDEVKTETETQTIFDLTYDIIVGYTRERSISPALKARLVELQARRNALAALGVQRTNLEKQLAAIEEDQSRIRQNMHELDKGSTLYKSYEKKLAGQEPQVESLHAGIVRLRDQAAQRTRELAAYAAAIRAD